MRYKNDHPAVHHTLLLEFHHSSSFLYIFSLIHPTDLSIKMKVSKYTGLLIAVLSTEASLIPSSGWRVIAGGVSTGAVALANKFMGERAAMIVAAEQGALHLIDTISTCIDAKSGEKEDIKICAESVVTTSAAFCLAYDHFQQTGSWSKRDGMLAHLDDYFHQMPEHISLSDIHYQGLPLNKTHLPQSLGKRDGSQDNIHAFHNSSMPLSFVYHNAKHNNVHLLVATNGTHLDIGHLEPTSQSNSTMSTRHLNRRAKFDPTYTHVGKGGAKVQCNSKYATMTETQVQKFMDEPLSSKNKKTGLAVYLDAINWSPMVGFSFKQWIVDSKKNYMSGQWALLAETKGFGSNWEKNWNWCFGVDERNCPKDLK